MKKWIDFFQKYRIIDINDDSDLLYQVGTTLGGSPISKEQHNFIVNSIIENLKLNNNDIVLDMCCGNGIITFDYSNLVHEIIGIDSSILYIENAKMYKKNKNINYYCDDILNFDKYVFNKKINKVVFYASLAYFTKQEIKNILDKLKKVGSDDLQIFIGGILDPEKKNKYFYSFNREIKFYFNNYFLQKKYGLGKWWSKKKLNKIAFEAGLNIVFINQNQILHTSHYRFDALLNSNTKSFSHVNSIPDSIGGYFELELRKGKEFHDSAIALNTGRNALELILKVKKYKKVYIPSFSCDVILESFEKTNTLYELYSIDKNFEPIFNKKLSVDEAFLYTNYFGLKDSFIKKLKKVYCNLIIDNSQSFFSLPEENVPTFYSCRKFFGVPDGAYLYFDCNADIGLPIDHSENRFDHLLKRIEYGVEAGHNDFKTNDNSFIGQPIKKMSKLTKALLCNIDYESVRKKRRENFITFHKQLAKYNELKIKFDKKSVPMVYPLLINRPGLKQKLAENKIYVATYWPNILERTNTDCIEHKYADQIIHLPVDQRCSSIWIEKIIKIVLLFIQEV